jgi:filamentous hemagglutinin
LGGCQGLPGLGDQIPNVFSINYNPGGALDHVVEAFAGPHDWLRDMTGSYDEFGNSIHLQAGSFALKFDEFKNFSLLFPATPFAAAGLIETTPWLFGTVSTLYSGR